MIGISTPSLSLLNESHVLCLSSSFDHSYIPRNVHTLSSFLLTSPQMWFCEKDFKVKSISSFQCKHKPLILPLPATQIAFDNLNYLSAFMQYLFITIIFDKNYFKSIKITPSMELSNCRGLPIPRQFQHKS